MRGWIELGFWKLVDSVGQRPKTFEMKEYLLDDVQSDT